MELDTAVRHKLPLLCIISLNGGWTADPDHDKPGRDLGYTRYDKMAEALGCYAVPLSLWRPIVTRGSRSTAGPKIRKQPGAPASILPDGRFAAAPRTRTSCHSRPSSSDILARTSMSRSA
jgi:hypothetical protein